MTFDTLVLSGGGTRGIVHLGALHHLHEKNIISFDAITTYAGSSIGTVVCLLMICGYTPMEIFKGVLEIDKFFDRGDTNDLSSIASKWGLLSPSKLFRILEGMVKEKCVTKGHSLYGLTKTPTLKDLYERTGIEFIITQANVSKTRLEYFSYRTHPNLSCISAVKMSCNIPLIFHRIRYRGCFYVDGGILDNFPLYPVDDGKRKILGLLLKPEVKENPINSFFDYVAHLTWMPIRSMTELRLRSRSHNCTILELETKSSASDMSVSHEEKTSLFMLGYTIAERFVSQLQDWRWEEEEEKEDES